MQKVEKFKIKKIIGLILFIIGVLLVVLGIILGISISKSNVKFNFKTEYEAFNDKEDAFGRKYLRINIPENNKMINADVNQILNIFNEKKDAVIYFGYPSCTYCRSAVSVLIETANKTKLDKIYYLITNDKAENYDEILDLFIDDFKDGDKIYSPLVLFVKEGNIISYHKGTLFSHTDPFTKLDDSQKEGLSQIYRNGINDVLDSIK